MQRIVGVLEMARKRATAQPPAEPPAEQGEAANKQAEQGEKRRQVNIDAELLRKAKAIAGDQDLTVPDYINNKLKIVIEEEFDSYMKAYGYTKSDCEKKT